MTAAEPTVDHILDALGNQTRRDILALLQAEPLSVGAIAQHFPISRPAVSKHLQILAGAGLIGYQALGRHNLFYIDPAGFQDVISYLHQFWDQSLANFKQIAEQPDEVGVHQ